ncbi:hypothetical protein K474DRAFT_1660058 [Panus rudis PR-1116 ss-1]|nr:hypothetical protein K474DRAFT_1660058 [Panus rudis PR-1116 ss-1]
MEDAERPIRSLQASIANIDGLQDASRRRIDELHGIIDSKVHEIAELQSELIKQKTSMSLMKGEFDLCKAHLAKVREELESMRLRLQLAERDSDELSRLRDRQRVQDGKLKETEQSLQNERLMKQALSSELEDLQRELSSVEVDRDKLQQLAVELRQENTIVVAQRDEFQKEATSLRGYLMQFKQAVVGLFNNVEATP